MPRKTIKVVLPEQDFEDIQSALTFTRRSYPDKKNNPSFMRAIARIEKKMWKILRDNREVRSRKAV